MIMIENRILKGLILIICEISVLLLYSQTTARVKINPEAEVSSASRILAVAPRVAKAEGYTKNSFEKTQFDITNTSSVLLNFVEVSKVTPAYSICMLSAEEFVLLTPFAQLLGFLSGYLFHIGFTNSLPHVFLVLSENGARNGTPND